MVVLLISRTCEYVTLHEKNDFEIRIQLKTLRRGNYFGPFPRTEGNVTIEKRI